MLGLETLEDPLRGVPLLRRRRPVRLQDRVDHRNQRPELRLLRLLRALISRWRREPAHLVDRVPAQAEHPRCFPPALTLNKNELPDRGIGFHGVHPRPTLPNRKRSAYPLAGFCSAMQQHPAAAPVADYSTAADSWYTKLRRASSRESEVSLSGSNPAWSVSFSNAVLRTSRYKPSLPLK